MTPGTGSGLPANRPLRLTTDSRDYLILRYPPDAAVPPAALAGPGLVSVTRTEAELSVVRPAAGAPTAPAVEPDWRLLAVDGPLDFSLTGVLAGLATTLAEAGVSLFAVSTFDTDYLLVKSDRLQDALRALAAAGYLVEGEPAGQRP